MAATTASLRTCALNRWRCSKPLLQNSKTRLPTYRKFIARFKAKASKAKQAQSRVKALDRMEKIAPLLSEADFTLSSSKNPPTCPTPCSP